MVGDHLNVLQIEGLSFIFLRNVVRFSPVP